MGEGTPRVEDKNGKKEEARPPREIEREIDHLRKRLDRSLAELDRRRHELTDVKLQMQKHPQAFLIAGGVVVLMLGGVGYAIYRSRKRQEPVEKAKRFRIAIGRAVDKPERVARGEPPQWEKIIAAVGTTIAVSFTKKMLERLWQSLPPPQR